VAEIPVNHRARPHGRSKYGLNRYLRGFFDLLSVTFMGRYSHRPLHLFGGVGLLMGFAGSLVLLYLTVIKIGGAAIGHRPLLTLGVLLIVVGIQLVSLGLLSELITRSTRSGRTSARVRSRSSRKSCADVGEEPMSEMSEGNPSTSDFVGPSGNATDKYGRKNPLTRWLLSRFLLEIDACPIAAPGLILDVGCGEGS
jgi:hypothetical protein